MVAKQSDWQISQEHKGQKPVSILPCQLQQACPTKFMERMTRGLSSTAAPKSTRLPSTTQPLLQSWAVSLPAPITAARTAALTSTLLTPLERTFPLPNILSKSMHPSTHLLQVERILLRTHCIFQNAGKAINPNFTCTPSRRTEDLAVMEEHYTNEQE